jgi:hypothetical protein
MKKKDNMTPPRDNNFTIMNYNDSEVDENSKNSKE